jgi:hypothetical protein
MEIPIGLIVPLAISAGGTPCSSISIVFRARSHGSSVSQFSTLQHMASLPSGPLTRSSLLQTIGIGLRFTI